MLLTMPCRCADGLSVNLETYEYKIDTFRSRFKACPPPFVFTAHMVCGSGRENLLASDPGRHTHA